MLKDSIQKIIIGGSGVITTGITPEIVPLIAPDVANMTSIIIQIIIGIATLFGLLRKKKVA